MATHNIGIVESIPSPIAALAPRAVRTLLVEDIPGLREALAAVLNSDPQVELVGTAQDGLAAITAAQATRPELVLMDINMPAMNGLTAAMHINRRLPGTKVILMSAEEDPRLAFAAMDCGADGFIPKSCWRRYRWHVRRLFFR